MRSGIIIFILFWGSLFELEAVETVKFSLPSLPAATLDEQFPRDSSHDIESLKKYKQDLEYFREKTLEGYNRSLIAYANTINESSKKLEELRRVQQVGDSDYEYFHRLLKDELQKLSRSGEYMALYFAALHKYQGRVKLADEEISQLALDERRTRYRKH